MLMGRADIIRPYSYNLLITCNNLKIFPAKIHNQNKPRDQRIYCKGNSRYQLPEKYPFLSTADLLCPKYSTKERHEMFFYSQDKKLFQRQEKET